MNAIITVIILCAIAGTIVILIYWLKNLSRNNNQENKSTDTTNISYEDYIKRTISTQNQTLQNNIPPQQIPTLPYQKKNLLTKTEYVFWLILKQQCDINGLLICPKVRMEDFINVTIRQNQLRYRGYIKSRHIDFIICDRNLNIVAGLELDDKTHQSPEAAQTDNFKNQVFWKIGLPLFRIRANTNYGEQINYMIQCIKTQRQQYAETTNR